MLLCAGAMELCRSEQLERGAQTTRQELCQFQTLTGASGIQIEGVAYAGALNMRCMAGTVMVALIIHTYRFSRFAHLSGDNALQISFWHSISILGSL